MPDLTWSTKVLWVIALAMLAFAFVVVSAESLKWALGSPSLIGSSAASVPKCPPPSQLRVDFLLARLGPHAAQGLLMRCRSEVKGTSAQRSHPGSSARLTPGSVAALFTRPKNP